MGGTFSHGVCVSVIDGAFEYSMGSGESENALVGKQVGSKVTGQESALEVLLIQFVILLKDVCVTDSAHAETTCDTNNGVVLLRELGRFCEKV